MASVRDLCRLLGVNRSWFYRAGARARAPAAEDTALREASEALVLAFPGYGYRRVSRALGRDGWGVNHKRVLRVMRAEALLCQLKRRWVPTTDAGHGLRTYPNPVKGTTVSGLGQVWVADITYVRLPRAFAYLAAILDACSRKVVGWAFSRWIDTRLTLQALERALASRPVAPGLIHHSDQGVQPGFKGSSQRLRERSCDGEAQAAPRRQLKTDIATIRCDHAWSVG